jgi:hypothetical protein
MSVSSAASSARSVQVSLGRTAVCRCRTASRWRSRRISASFRSSGDPQPRGDMDGENEHEAQEHETRSSATGKSTANRQYPDDLPVRSFPQPQARFHDFTGPVSAGTYLRRNLGSPTPV